MLRAYAHCRTFDPEEADFFYVPVWYCCWMWPVNGWSDYPFWGAPTCKAHGLVEVGLEGAGHGPRLPRARLQRRVSLPSPSALHTLLVVGSLAPLLQHRPHVASRQGVDPEALPLLGEKRGVPEPAVQPSPGCVIPMLRPAAAAPAT